MLQTVQIDQLSLQYISSPDPLIKNLSVSFSQGWTGIVGPNGSGKTTLLKSICYEGKVEDLNISGIISKPESFHYCSQRCDFPPEEGEDFLAALYGGDNGAGRLMGILELDHDWYYRWDTLSFGERKRFQLAVSLWKEPELLAVDEPSNHLDEQGRNLLLEGLRLFRGIGILVSHDRELLDDLCNHTLFLKSSGSVILSGGVTHASEELEKIRLQERREFQNAKDKLKALEHEAANRRKLAADQHKRRSKKGLAIKDHDGRFKKNAARISGKDGTGGKLLRQMDGRLDQARTRLDSIKPEQMNITGISIQSRSIKRDLLLHMEPQEIIMGEGKTLILPELILTPGDRISLRGVNGSGKSTLLRLIQKELLIPPEESLWIPQEISLHDQSLLVKRLSLLNNREKGEILSTVSRLGSRPESVLDSQQFSPGEARKLLLALGIVKVPELIVLDEPTNHMDLPSIKAIEEALTGLNISLLLVSHDRVFRKRLCDKEWIIEAQGNKYQKLFQLRIDLQ